MAVRLRKIVTAPRGCDNQEGRKASEGSPPFDCLFCDAEIFVDRKVSPCIARSRSLEGARLLDKAPRLLQPVANRLYSTPSNSSGRRSEFTSKSFTSQYPSSFVNSSQPNNSLSPTSQGTFSQQPRRGGGKGKRPLRPLSYDELLARQKAQVDLSKRQAQAQEQYNSEVQGAYILPPPILPASKTSHVTPKPGSSFRPKPGTKRHRRILYRTQLGLDNKHYPFPEDFQPLSGPRKRKPIYFKKGHKFLLTRGLLLKKQIIKRDPANILKRLAARTALKIVEKRKMERGQRKVDLDVLRKWHPGGETIILPVTSSDITKDTKEKVVFKEFSETKANIKLGAGLLKAGEVIGFPTETVYGLGANALSTEAVQKIYTAKNRPSDNPLIVHFGSISHLQSFFGASSFKIPSTYLPLIETFWPGPLTILLTVTPSLGISPLVTAGLDTVAVRIPSSPLARALIQEANVPVAAPSANASTRPSPTMGEHVHRDLNTRIPLILSADGDLGSPCDVGLESTVVDGLSSPPMVLRLGGVSLESIQALGGIWRDTVVYEKPPLKSVTNGDATVEDEKEFKPRTPGMKYRHYSPSCPVYLYPANSPQPRSPSIHLPVSDSMDRKIAMLCTKNWEPMIDENAEIEFNWLGGDDEEVARNLFKCVREMDEWGAECIIVEGIEEKGLGRSVMERLRKMSGGVVQGQV